MIALVRFPWYFFLTLQYKMPERVHPRPCRVARSCLELDTTIHACITEDNCVVACDDMAHRTVSNQEVVNVENTSPPETQAPQEQTTNSS
jgi:hypothetical protein